MSDDGLTLYVTPEADLLHTRECPHLTPSGLSTLIPATASEIQELRVCQSCRTVLDGGRRRVFSTLDAALEAFRAPLENRPRLREIASSLPYERVWMPASESYIGLAGPEGGVAIAYFGHGYADLRKEGGGGYDREWLPTNRSGSRATASSSPLLAERACPTCHMTLPATGVCDDCG